jgi:hypothetical protein
MMTRSKLEPIHHVTVMLTRTLITRRSLSLFTRHPYLRTQSTLRAVVLSHPSIVPPHFARAMTRDVSHQADIAKSQNDNDGQFRRKDSQFRDSITDDGKFTPEKGRYRLYVSYACRE